jgi:branched-chain amino acid transport system substrate-binding protein
MGLSPGSREEAQIYSYEVTDATIDSPALELQNRFANVVITAATLKFAARSIRKIADWGWNPLHFMTNVWILFGSAITPARQENATAPISAAI